MKNENMSIWIREARKQGIDLSAMYQDKLKIYDVLEILGLPTPKRYTLDPKEIENPWVEEIFRNNTYFCRLIPNDKEKTRPYKMRVTTKEELKIFYEEQRGEYTIMLVEKGEVRYSGVIIAIEDGEEQRGVVELVKGDGEDLAHGKKTPLHGKWEARRKIKYINQIPKKEEEQIIEQAIRAIGYPKAPFPGYYEFEVWKENQIIFRNYQSPQTPYGKLP